MQGWDKTYCLRYVQQDFDEIHFFGDKTFEASGVPYSWIARSGANGTSLPAAAILGWSMLLRTQCWQLTLNLLPWFVCLPAQPWLVRSGRQILPLLQ